MEDKDWFVLNREYHEFFLAAVARGAAAAAEEEERIAATLAADNEEKRARAMKWYTSFGFPEWTNPYVEVVLNTYAIDNHATLLLPDCCPISITGNGKLSVPEKFMIETDIDGNHFLRNVYVDWYSNFDRAIYEANQLYSHWLAQKEEVTRRNAEPPTPPPVPDCSTAAAPGTVPNVIDASFSSHSLREFIAGDSLANYETDDLELLHDDDRAILIAMQLASINTLLERIANALEAQRG